MTTPGGSVIVRQSHAHEYERDALLELLPQKAIRQATLHGLLKGNP